MNFKRVGRNYHGIPSTLQILQKATFISSSRNSKNKRRGVRFKFSGLSKTSKHSPWLNIFKKSFQCIFSINWKADKLRTPSLRLNQKIPFPFFVDNYLHYAYSYKVGKKNNKLNVSENKKSKFQISMSYSCKIFCFCGILFVCNCTTSYFINICSLSFR